MSRVIETMGEGEARGEHVGSSGECLRCGWERMAHVSKVGDLNIVAFYLWHPTAKNTPEPCEECVRWRDLTSQARPISPLDSGDEV